MIMSRTTVLFAFLVGLVDAFSEPFLAGYKPHTQITDFAALDLDQEKLEERAGVADFDHAKIVYEQGGHSGSFAEIELTDVSGAATTLKAGSTVMGQAENGDGVLGELLHDADLLKNTNIRVKYLVNSDPTTAHVGCMVGGLYTFLDGFRKGCLAHNGTVEIVAFDSEGTAMNMYPYNYDGRKDNKNFHTLQKMSTGASRKMHFCEGGAVSADCDYHEDFRKYVNYYGDTDFGDKWMQAALVGRDTSFSSKRGDALFSSLTGNGGGGRREAMKRGSVLLIVFLEILHKMEEAVHFCNKHCGGNSDVDCAVESWDQAWALYSGSLEGEDGKGDGVFHYSIADRRAREFKTNGYLSTDSKGKSFVNLEVLYLFKSGRDLLSPSHDDEDRCETVKERKSLLTSLMIVPMVQGLYRNAWMRQYNPQSHEMHEAAGASYAAALLPLLHDCDPDSARTVLQMTGVGSKDEDVDFDKLRDTVKKQYACLGISCAQVGGLFTNGKYVEGAGPCFDGKQIVDRTPQSENASSQGSAVIVEQTETNPWVMLLGILLLAFGFVLIAGLALLMVRRRQNAKLEDRVANKNIAAVTVSFEEDGLHHV